MAHIIRTLKEFGLCKELLYKELYLSEADLSGTPCSPGQVLYATGQYWAARIILNHILSLGGHDTAACAMVYTFVEC